MHNLIGSLLLLNGRLVRRRGRSLPDRSLLHIDHVVHRFVVFHDDVLERDFILPLAAVFGSGLVAASWLVGPWWV